MQKKFEGASFFLRFLIFLLISLFSCIGLWPRSKCALFTVKVDAHRLVVNNLIGRFILSCSTAFDVDPSDCQTSWRAEENPKRYFVTIDGSIWCWCRRRCRRWRWRRGPSLRYIRSKQRSLGSGGYLHVKFVLSYEVQIDGKRLQDGLTEIQVVRVYIWICNLA